MRIVPLFVFATLSLPLHAQIQSIASDSFEYTANAVLDDQVGGTGFASPWTISPNGDEFEVFDATATTFPLADATGNFAGQVAEGAGAYRNVDALGHPDVAEFGEFGRDGASLWISFTSLAYIAPGDGYGGLSLFDAGNERLFIGSPWASYAWGVDDKFGNVYTVPGSNTSMDARIVLRIDHQPGDERLRMWLNPPVAHPISPADIDVVIPDLRWNRIRLESGGSGSMFYWDDIQIEKDGSTLGTSFCDGNANSTGAVGTMALQGSAVVADNALTLLANDLPSGQFGIFTGSMNTANPSPVASGVLCLGGAIARFQGPGQVFQVGATGSVSLPIDLTMIPLPNGVVSAQAGETWHFQAWHRDFTTAPTSNFTEGVSVQLF